MKNTNTPDTPDTPKTLTTLQLAEGLAAKKLREFTSLAIPPSIQFFVRHDTKNQSFVVIVRDLKRSDYFIDALSYDY